MDETGMITVQKPRKKTSGVLVSLAAAMNAIGNAMLPTCYDFLKVVPIFLFFLIIVDLK